MATQLLIEKETGWENTVFTGYHNGNAFTRVVIRDSAIYYPESGLNAGINAPLTELIPCIDSVMGEVYKHLKLKCETTKRSN